MGDREAPAIDLAAIEARANAATPGPWAWFGNVDHNDFYLATRHSGRRYVMSFRRAGMQNAQPEFQDYSGPYGRMAPAKELAIYEVAPDATSRRDPYFNIYRADIIGFRNPDAEFIAHARQDVDTLIARVHELEQQLADAKGTPQ